MKYLVIGAGGVGGMLSASLKKANKDVSVIARNKHLKAIQEKGLTVKSELLGNFTVKINAFSQEENTEKFDVIFVCTKFYSLDDIIPYIKNFTHEKTVIIPLLNGFGIGEILQNKLPKLNILDGCIYIVSFITDLGEISHPSKIFKIFFGERKGQNIDKNILKTIEKDLNDAKIEAKYSENIEKDTFTKFTLISPYAACGAYYNVPLKEMQTEGKERNLLINLLTELQNISEKLNIKLDFDIIQRNLDFVDKMPPETISSLHRDILNGHQSEIDNQIFQVVRIGKKLGINVEKYEEIAKKFNFIK